MRAVQVPEHGATSVLEVAEVQKPVPGDGEVLIDVAYAGVNFADLAKRRGSYPGGPTPPYVPGIEVSGRVVESGGDGQFAAGDAVMAYVPRGGYADAATVDVERVFRVPEGLPLADAAAVPIQWVTAHNALFEWGGLEEGERVLVHAAAGGVGTAAVQLAATAGAAVYATASTAEKRRLASGLGADHAIDYVDDELAPAVADLTSGEGIDLVLDGVGGDAFDASLDALSPGGRIVAYGLASGDVPVVSTPELFFDNHSVVGYHLGHAVEHTPERVFDAVEPVASALSAGDVEVVHDRTYPLADAAEAHRRIENRESMGKVLIRP